MATRPKQAAESATVGNSNNSGQPITRLGIARYEQSLINPSLSGTDSYIETMSHVLTTVDSKQDVASQHQEGSLYSYVSTRDIRQFVKEASGRIFNTLSDTYLLPTDETEWNRLDKQHSAVLIALGSLVPCPELLETVLAPVEGETKRVLDVGCGTGTWAIQMALQFPYAAVQGVDLAPVPLDPAQFPPNLQFEIDDVNQGMEHFYDQFDVVHSRCLVVGLTDGDRTLREMERCLKPGGLLVIVDGDKDMYDAQRHKIPMAKLEGDEDVSSVSSEGSWFERKMWEAHEAATLAGSNHERAGEIIDTGLWDHPLCDRDTVVSGHVYIPIGPWATSPDPLENEALKFSGTLMRQVFLSIHKGYHDMILRHGISQETLDEWTTRVDDELNSSRLRMWCSFRFCWARRRTGEGLPAPTLPTHPSGASATISRRRPLYSSMETHYTRDEAIAARKKKREAVGVWPTSAIQRAMGQLNQS